MNEIEVGDAVTYSSLNLRNYRGFVTSLGRTKNGGDCLVKWDNFPFASEEWTGNLRRDTE